MPRVSPSSQWAEVEGFEPITIAGLRIVLDGGVLKYTDDSTPEERLLPTAGVFVAVGGVLHILLED